MGNAGQTAISNIIWLFLSPCLEGSYCEMQYDML